MEETAQGLLERLSRLDFFAGLPQEAISRLAAQAQRVLLSEGEFLCRRGDPGPDLYFIEVGALEVRQGKRLLALMGRGQVVGELAVLDERPRAADLVASEATTVLLIPGPLFRELLGEYPQFPKQLLAALSTRYRQAASRQLQVDQLIRAYRERGHVIATLDPLGVREAHDHPELSLAYHGLGETDLDAIFTVMLSDTPLTLPLSEIIERVEAIYCQAIGVQFMHIDDLALQRWIRERLENPLHARRLPREQQLQILRKLTDAEVFEAFLHNTFSRSKRFSLEGAETLIPLLEQAISRAGEVGVEEIIIGMPHRGRLNVLANIMGCPPHLLFQRFETLQSEESSELDGDVRFHMGFDSTRTLEDGRELQLSLCFNPSHLEFIGPVVSGRCRARQDKKGDRLGKTVLPLVLHGDAAFAGQGIVQESLNLGGVDGFSTGGTVHIVLNNQIGFTTPPEQSRSTHYATDVARMLQIPIFHVNGERPVAVDRVIRMALDFRQTWGRDVVVDMYCYRRRGHMELDDPTFTQPQLYKVIEKHPPIREAYSHNLLQLGEVSDEEAQAIAASSRQSLDAALAALSGSETENGRSFGSLPGALELAPPSVSSVRDDLAHLCSLPDGFQAHRKVTSIHRRRQAMLAGKQPIDWATGEALAFASILRAGCDIRLTGQDSERGTFGHRHAVLHAMNRSERFVPLAHLSDTQGAFHVYNSPLSEAGVLAFEFGYSLEHREALVIWEAQFGDFANGAQVIIDQFLVSSQAKWGLGTRLCLFLPHGLEGEGPEHSSARPERFLQLAAQENLHLCFLSTASQVFHRLRLQVASPQSVPLIVLTPKRSLQLPISSSPLKALTEGAFHPVLSDPAPPEVPSHIVLCGGPFGQSLLQERSKDPSLRPLIIRLEQLYPFPEEALLEALAPWPDLPLIWAQEEPENQGPWWALRHTLTDLFPGFLRTCISRPASSVPAQGNKKVYLQEQADLIKRALEVGI